MTQLIHTLDSHVDLVHDCITLFSYVYRPQTPAVELSNHYRRWEVESRAD